MICVYYDIKSFQKLIRKLCSLGTKAEGAHEDPLSPTEQERMIEEIAKRLNRIADECVQRMGTGEPQTTRGAVAEPLLSPNSRSMY